MTRVHDEFDGRAAEIEQKAAEWVTRIDLRGTPEEWAALDAWLSASPRHRAAFLRLSVAWRRADGLKQFAPLSGAVDKDLLDPARARRRNLSADDLLEGRTISLQPLHAQGVDSQAPAARSESTESTPANHGVTHADAADAESVTRPTPARTLRVVASTANPIVADTNWAATRRYRASKVPTAGAEGTRASHAQAPSDRMSWMSKPSRLAASIAVLAVTAILGLSWYLVQRGDVRTYSTQVGEFHRITLSDGSTIALNTDSEVRVRYTRGARHVDLLRGEAMFEVAKNPRLPFDVEAGRTTVLAVGTAFSVRLREENKVERVDVVVSEGRITINPPSTQTYAAGSVATVRKNGVVSATLLSSEDINEKLAWTTGRLAFLNEKLGDVVAEINRYNRRKLIITDPAIAELRIGGTFQATDPDGFAKALKPLGIQSQLDTRPLGNDVIRLDSAAQ